MTRLSVNINKVATLRNARGGNLPDIINIARDIERFGAEGITVHPRSDERHIRYQDVMDLKDVVTTEFNIEGYPSREWIDLVVSIKPAQATLVPDGPDQLTSDHGWDTLNQEGLLLDIISELKQCGCRVSIFIDPDKKLIEGALKTTTDRIELYTGPFAQNFTTNRESAVAPFVEAAKFAESIGLGVNAGHDLNLDNLKYFKDSVIPLDEVSIGHALISDSLYFGLEDTVGKYLEELN